MEGKYTKLVRENRVELGALLFFVCCLIAAVALFIFLLPAPSGTAFAVQKRNGAFVITHRKEKYQTTLPDIVTEQPDLQTLDFYSKEGNCRLTVEENTKQGGEQLDAWIHTDEEQLQQFTLIYQDKQFFNPERSRVLYRVETVETGKTDIYYEDKGSYIFEMRMFGDDSSCYETFETYIKNIQ